MLENYDAYSDENLEQNAPEEDSYAGVSGSSPLSQFMIQRAKEVSPRRQDIISRRDALLSAYKNLVEAKKYKQVPGGGSFPEFLGSSYALSQSDSGGMRMLGQMQLATAKAMMEEHQKQSEAEKDQATTNLQMNAQDLDFYDKDQKQEVDFLKNASNIDNENQVMQMKMMLAALRSSKNNGTPVPSTNDQSLKELGVPKYSGPDPYAGTDSVGQRQIRMNYEKKIQKMQEEADALAPTINNLKRFQELNEEEKNSLLGTGPVADYVPNLSDNLQEMASISAKLTPLERAPGSGAASDFDAKMFQKATVGTNKDYAVNKNIATARTIDAQNQMDKAQFFENYLSAHNHLRGAQQAWQKYLNANPIFDQNGKKFELNSARKTWQEFFSGEMKDKEGVPSESLSEEEIPPPPPGYDSERWKKIYKIIKSQGNDKYFGGSNAP